MAELKKQEIPHLRGKIQSGRKDLKMFRK